MSGQDPLEPDFIAEQVNRQDDQVKRLSEWLKQQGETDGQQSLINFNLGLRSASIVSGKGQATGCYRNWIIKLISQDNDWTVAYCTPGGEIFIDGKTYGTAEVALATARDLVDRSIAGFALLEFLFELYDARKISTEQYSQLTSSLIQGCL